MKTTETKCINNDEPPLTEKNEPVSQLNDSTAANAAVLILPAALPVESILGLFVDEPKTYGERALWLLSYIYVSGLFRFKKKNAPVQIHSDTLQLILGKKSLKSGDIKEKRGKGGEREKGETHPNPQATITTQYLYILGKLSDYVDVIPDFRIGVYSQSYRLKIRKIKNAYSAQQAHKLRSIVLIKALQKLTDKVGNSFKKISPAHRKIFNSVSEVEYNWIEAEKTLNPKHRAHHEMLKSKTMHWKRDLQGRVYTSIVLMPRVLRKFLTWRGERLWSTDITSSQLCLHIALYPDGTDVEEKERYKKLCERGQLYDHLNNLTATPLDMEDEEQRRRFKDRVFGEIFYSHPENKSRSELREVFGREFPILSRRIHEVKGQGGQYRELPKIMQEIESEIVIDGVIGDLKAIDAPLIPIHDCILTTEAHIESVSKKLLEGFQLAVGVTPKVKTREIQ